MEAFRTRWARREGDPTEDAMTRTFRKTLMATTMLAGLAIFGIDAAQAGPNGGPSLGSISGFSSMRMDFNRIGGPNRALSREDTRVVPLDTVKKPEKPKDTKNAAKKGTDIARISNPKSASGGKGKEDVSSRPDVRIPAPLAELYRVTGGNLDDISRLAELASWLKTGPLAAGSPLFGTPGDGTFVPPTFGADDRFGWGGAKGGAGNNTPQRIGNPDGKAGGYIEGTDSQTGDGWVRYDDWGRTNNGGHYHHTFWLYEDGSTRTVDDYHAPNGTHDFITTSVDADGGGTYKHYRNGEDVTRLDTEYNWPVNMKPGDSASDAAEKPQKEKEEAKKKDSQPTEEGTGRPSRGMHTVRCDIAGCIDLGMTDGRRVNPGHGNPEGSSSAGSGGGGLPSWATDPCPDCGGRVAGGGGFHRPGGSDIGWGGPGSGGEGGANPPLPAPR